MGELLNDLPPIVGTPLLLDSLKDNGMLQAIADAMDDDKTTQNVIDDLTGSTAALSPVRFTLKEKLKWSFYKSIRGKALEFMGFDVYL